MQTPQAERQVIKERVLARHCDWAGLHVMLRERHGLSISQSSLDRFFAGRSNSKRTWRILATLLGTTPEELAPAKPLAPDASPAPAIAAAGGRGARLQDPEAFQLAYQWWVEMKTRVAGQPIDPATDLIVECHESWQALLGVGRDLLKSVPLHKKPDDAELRRLVQLMERVLDRGLRPHLQAWAGALRRWLTTPDYAAHLAAGLPPQAAQQRYPRWAALRADLGATNRRLRGYLAELEAMVAHPTARATSAGKRPRPRSRRMAFAGGEA